VLAEHKLQVSGFVDEKTAAKVGQLTGAQALIFPKVSECGAGRGEKQEPILVNNRPVVDYFTQGQVSGSMRIIDLTSGRVLAAQDVEGRATLTSQSDLRRTRRQSIRRNRSRRSPCTGCSFPGRRRRPYSSLMTLSAG